MNSRTRSAASSESGKKDAASFLDGILDGSAVSSPSLSSKSSPYRSKNGGSSARKQIESTTTPSPSSSKRGHQQSRQLQSKYSSPNGHESRHEKTPEEKSTPSPPLKVVTPKRRLTVVNPFEFRTTARSDLYQSRLQQRLEEEQKRKVQSEPRHFKPRAVPPTTYQYQPISKVQSNCETLRRAEKLREKKLQDLQKREEEESAQYQFRPPPKTTHVSPQPLSPRVEESLRRSMELHNLKIQEQRQRGAPISPSKHRPVPPTTYQPKPILPEKEQKAMNDALAAREKKLDELRRRDEEKKSADGSPKKPRPVPSTTYHPKPILQEKEEKALRDAALAREKKLEEQRKREEEKKIEEEGSPPKASPAPSTTYSPRLIFPEMEEKALRDAALAREHKLEELRKLEEDKKRKEEAVFKPRPVPPTTYKPNPISPQSEQKALNEALLTREHKLEEERQRLEVVPFKPRPVPKTTYTTDQVSPKNSQALQKAEERGQVKRSQHADAKFTFRARTVPKSLYSPVPVKSAHTASSSTAVMAKTPPSTKLGKEKAEFHARVVPVTTYKAEVFSPAKKTMQESSKKPSSPPKSKAGENQIENAYEFHARPVPKTTYIPAILSPKSRGKTNELVSAFDDGENDREIESRDPPVPKTLCGSVVDTPKPLPNREDPDKPVEDWAKANNGEESKSLAPPAWREETETVSTKQRGEIFEQSRLAEPQADDALLNSPKSLAGRENAAESASSLTQTDVKDGKENEFEVHGKAVPKPTYKPDLISPKSRGKREEPKKETNLASPSFRARPVPKSTYHSVPIKKETAPRPVKASSAAQTAGLGSTTITSPNFRARSVPKSAYAVTSPSNAVTSPSNAASSPSQSTSFRPISSPRKPPHTNLSQETGPSSGVRLVQTTLTTDNPLVSTLPTVNTTVSTQVAGTSKQRSPREVFYVLPTEDAVDNSEELAAAILRDEESPEITFTRDENSDDDPELADILGGLDGWNVTGPDDEEEEEFDDMLRC